MYFSSVWKQMNNRQKPVKIILTIFHENRQDLLKSALFIHAISIYKTNTTTFSRVTCCFHRVFSVFERYFAIHKFVSNFTFEKCLPFNYFAFFNSSACSTFLYRYGPRRSYQWAARSSFQRGTCECVFDYAWLWNQACCRNGLWRRIERKKLKTCS